MREGARKRSLNARPAMVKPFCVKVNVDPVSKGKNRMQDHETQK
jgi:hypothetical protein